MISAYHRPKTLEEALKLLTQPNRVPLGGGTLLSRASTSPTAPLSATGSVEAIDLQLLGLDSLRLNGNNFEIGATVTLQTLLESELCPKELKTALKLEAPLNIRNSATVAGTIVACDGRSSFATALLALDAKLDVRPLTADHRPSSTVHGLGEFLPLRPRGLITSITVPLNAKLAFEYVARTPSDSPIVCVAVAVWGSGRTRMAVGGYGKSPALAMDGTSSDDLATAARNAFHEATDDFASAKYRMDVAATLAKRCLESFK
ncbi:MAG: FAD binding domain-containing protein [Anaerolineales bacterium]|nr:FAD binding domain-containing protein [Anaerolineales bacterium]